MTAEPEQRARNATMFDVARLAGVSHQTVSRVLNQHPNVREATRERVQAAAKQLRYRPNVAARVMANRQSRTIGLVTTGSPDYGPSSTVLGFASAARQAHYSVTISTAVDTEPESMRASVDLLLGQQVEAVVVVASRTADAGRAGRQRLRRARDRGRADRRRPRSPASPSTSTPEPCWPSNT